MPGTNLPSFWSKLHWTRGSQTLSKILQKESLQLRKLFSRIGVTFLLNIEDCLCFYLFHGRGPNYIEISPMIYKANQSTGFFMVGTCVMNKLIFQVNSKKYMKTNWELWQFIDTWSSTFWKKKCAICLFYSKSTFTSLLLVYLVPIYWVAEKR